MKSVPKVRFCYSFSIVVECAKWEPDFWRWVKKKILHTPRLAPLLAFVFVHEEMIYFLIFWDYANHDYTRCKLNSLLRLETEHNNFLSWARQLPVSTPSCSFDSIMYQNKTKFLQSIARWFHSPSLSYNRKASFSSSCIAATSSTSSSTRNPAAKVTNSSNSSCPEPVFSGAKRTVIKMQLNYTNLSSQITPT